MRAIGKAFVFSMTPPPVRLARQRRDGAGTFPGRNTAGHIQETRAG
jgi:hypothetical protein